MSSRSLKQLKFNSEGLVQYQRNQSIKKIREINKLLKEEINISEAQKAFYCKQQRKYMKSYLRSLIKKLR